jgi:hypothetical protein
MADKLPPYPVTYGICIARSTVEHQFILTQNLPLNSFNTKTKRVLQFGHWLMMRVFVDVTNLLVQWIFADHRCGYIQPVTL